MLTIKEINDAQVSIWYKDIRGNYNRKPFIFPKEILIDEEFIAGLGLFLGDGDMHRKEKNHLNYASIDKDIAKHALDFLKSKFNLDIKDVTFTIVYKRENNKWQQVYEGADPRSPHDGVAIFLLSKRKASMPLCRILAR